MAGFITAAEGMTAHFICGCENDVWLRGEYIVILLWFTYLLAERQLLVRSQEKKDHRIGRKWFCLCPVIPHILFHGFVLRIICPFLSFWGTAALGSLVLRELVILGSALQALCRKCGEAWAE